jgi:hypothetical protein
MTCLSARLHTVTPRVLHGTSAYKLLYLKRIFYLILINWISFLLFGAKEIRSNLLVYFWLSLIKYVLLSPLRTKPCLYHLWPDYYRPTILYQLFLTASQSTCLLIFLQVMPIYTYSHFINYKAYHFQSLEPSKVLKKCLINEAWLDGSRGTSFPISWIVGSVKRKRKNLNKWSLTGLVICSRRSGVFRCKKFRILIL